MDSIALVGAAGDYRYVQLRKLWTEEPGRMVRVSLRTAESAPTFRRLGTVPRRPLSFDMGAGTACHGRVARTSPSHAIASHRFPNRRGLARGCPVHAHLVRAVDSAAFDLPLSRPARPIDRRVDRGLFAETVPSPFR